MVGPIRRRHAVEVRDVEFLRRNTDRAIKITLPGPFTLTRQAKDEHYRDEEALAMDYAAAINAEARDLKAAGADVIQLDEPWLQAFPEQAMRYGVRAINRALEGIPSTTAVHLCFGYAHLVRDKKRGRATPSCRSSPTPSPTRSRSKRRSPTLDLGVLKALARKTIILGVIDLGNAAVETPEEVARRIRRGLEYLSPDRLVPAPDCGMKYLSRDAAFGKLKALADGARDRAAGAHWALTRPRRGGIVAAPWSPGPLSPVSSPRR